MDTGDIGAPGSDLWWPGKHRHHGGSVDPKRCVLLAGFRDEAPEAA
jgi:hypothetical protein